MIIPIRDLYGLKAQKAFRFGHSGLIVVIKGHEEVFLEFSSSKRRKACVTLLEELMEEVRIRSERGEIDLDDLDEDRIHTRIMEDLDESAPVNSKGTGGMDSVPQVSPSPLFGSTTSTFLEFKPDPMRITCLTIGSRGDVQPYIALCKGLQAEGHTTRIATHGEYKDWVEGVSGLPCFVFAGAHVNFDSTASNSPASVAIQPSSCRCVSIMACSQSLS